MPTEIIGEPDTPAGATQEQIATQAEQAIKYILKACGPPPREMELELQREERELGSYPVIALVWGDAMRGAPWEYITKCENALSEFENMSQENAGQSRQHMGAENSALRGPVEKLAQPNPGRGSNTSQIEPRSQFSVTG